MSMLLISVKGKNTLFKEGDEIEIPGVGGFSMGVGPFTIWAMGKAGWFEIVPAPHYRQIYQDMDVGVALYYFLSDTYAGKSKTQMISFSIGEIVDEVCFLVTPEFLQSLIQSYSIPSTEARKSLS
jgi:hypothetical protein